MCKDTTFIFLLRETISAISAAILEGKQPLPRGFQKMEREIYQWKKQHQSLERLSHCHCSRNKHRLTVRLNHLNIGASTYKIPLSFQNIRTWLADTAKDLHETLTSPGSQLSPEGTSHRHALDIYAWVTEALPQLLKCYCNLLMG